MMKGLSSHGGRTGIKILSVSLIYYVHLMGIILKFVKHLTTFEIEALHIKTTKDDIFVNGKLKLPAEHCLKFVPHHVAHMFFLSTNQLHRHSRVVLRWITSLSWLKLTKRLSHEAGFPQCQLPTPDCPWLVPKFLHTGYYRPILYIDIIKVSSFKISF